MATISTVTDRADGEVLTAAKYNADHGVHETNATNLNTGKVEISNYNTEHGPTGAHSEDQVRDSINLATTDAVTFNTMRVLGSAVATPVAKTLYEDSIVKAWLNQSGTTTPVISGDVNISSITDNGVGDRSPAFSTAMGNNTYAVTAGILWQGGAPATVINSLDLATGSYRYGIDSVDSLTNPAPADLAGAWTMVVGKN